MFTFIMCGWHDDTLQMFLTHYIFSRLDLTQFHLSWGIRETIPDINTSIHVYKYNDPKSHYKRFLKCVIRDCLIQLVPLALPFSAPHRHLTPKLTQASKKFYRVHPRRSFIGFDISWIWLFLIWTTDRHEMRSRLAPSHIQLGQLNFNSS